MAYDTPRDLEGLKDARDPQEIREIWGTDDPDADIPTIEAPEIIEEDGDIDIWGNVETSEQLDRRVEGEVQKTEATLDFAEEALRGAIAHTHEEDTFADEAKELASLREELQAVTLDKPSSEEVSQLNNDTNTKAEETQEIEPKYGVNIKGVEIPAATELEHETIERAANICYYSREKAQSVEEIQGLLNKLEIIKAQTFEDDAVFDKAVEVFMQEAKYWEVNSTLLMENGAVDVATGRSIATEIIASQSEIESTTRPTAEELEAANKALLGTTRGRLLDMTAYLQDYEAVATNQYRQSEITIPANRLRELKIKSWFDAQVENKTTAPEVVGGLGLTWESAADYYESIGNITAAEQIRNTGKYEVTHMDTGDIIVGETHLRLVNNPEYQRPYNQMLKGLKTGDRVIVEHSSDPRLNAWSAISTEKRFMAQAQEFAKETEGIELEILDDASASKWETWEASQEDLGLSRKEYYYMNGMIDASDALMSEGGIAELIKKMREAESLTPADQQAAFGGIRKYLSIITDDSDASSKLLGDINRMKLLYYKLDSQCRERAYQTRIHDLREKTDGNLMIVVGNGHKEGIEHTLNDPNYRTEINPDDVAELNRLVDELVE